MILTFLVRKTKLIIMKYSKKALEEIKIDKKIQKIVREASREAERAMKLNFIPSKNFSY